MKSSAATTASDTCIPYASEDLPRTGRKHFTLPPPPAAVNFKAAVWTAPFSRSTRHDVQPADGDVPPGVHTAAGDGDGAGMDENERVLFCDDVGSVLAV